MASSTIDSLRALNRHLKQLQGTWNGIIATLPKKPRMPYLFLGELSDTDVLNIYQPLHNITEAFFNVLADTPPDVYTVPNADREIEAFKAFENDFGFRAKMMDRALKYRMKGELNFGIPRDMQKRYSCQEFSRRGEEHGMKIKVKVMEHIIWLMERGENGYDAASRYQSVFHHPSWSVEDRLGERYTWMLRPERSVPNVEWQFMIAVAGKMMQQRAGHEVFIREMLRDARASGYRIPKSTLATVTNKVCRTEYLANWQAGECCILCCAEFDDETPPVVFHCGHIPGIFCAKHWAEDYICQYCLGMDPSANEDTDVSNLQEQLHGPFKNIGFLVQTMQALDHQIDAFILAGPQETYDMSIGDLLKKLHKLTVSYDEAKSELRDAVWEVRKDADPFGRDDEGELGDIENSSDVVKEDDIDMASTLVEIRARIPLDYSQGNC
ncbi:hypothetical protein P154DRAFT_537542 [Amniculicola lignicola CBS 123094]|uniref:Uncharacterized protein n=1 Tax=Amniculicola lignicola CBS 123094 TaxID=1392246 RepID=A0A6A5WD28_9PLEO|nr:hypothetical protein P154DRAFT_537542 [Amniculicola lignicola CBS 123094]